jgi:hypothetical protein
MVVIIVMLLTDQIDSTRTIFLDDVYLRIYRFLSRFLAVLYIFIIKVKALRRIRRYSMMRPKKLICGIYIVIFIMVTILIYYIYLLLIFIPQNEDIL